ncbi:MAG: hypothetical protein FJ275_04255 [Planctomycetes bacterium]|nr:hypothetical protein [Planctomycetota bacterium]MBM4057436.1 hypothetical protein [Planctomycetota bacterium]
MREDLGVDPARSKSAFPGARGCASAAILLYLAAVVVPPLAGPAPASELASRLLQPLRPLVGTLFLGHGYRFFAPNPGPGHTIRWTMTMPDGSRKSGRIPDEALDRPRLLYHRRFMVSEKISALVPPADAPREVRDRARQDWQPLVKGVAAHLLQREGGLQVTLETVEHYLPEPAEVLGSGTFADAVTPLGSYAWTEASR